MCQPLGMWRWHWGLCVALATLAALGCASGPHPAIPIAAKAFPCDEKALTLHEIGPRMVRVEGCGKDATYVKVCDGYGIDSKCGWGRKKD